VWGIYVEINVEEKTKVTRYFFVMEGGVSSKKLRTKGFVGLIAREVTGSVGWNLKQGGNSTGAYAFSLCSGARLRLNRQGTRPGRTDPSVR